MNLDYTLGDDIVCIRTHEEGAFKEGDVFKCKALKIESCKCKCVIVDIGISNSYGFGAITICRICSSEMNEDGIWWFDASRFRKLDTIVNIDEIHELLNEPLYS